MPKILYVSELGGNLNHLNRIYPILLALDRLGNEISAALHSPHNLQHAWPKLRLEAFQAPCKTQPAAYEVHPIKYYVDILNNIGWGDPQELQTLLDDWQALYNRVKPHFVIHDYSPTALLISQSLGILHTTFGTGFSVPPDESPTRLLRAGVAADPALEQRISNRLVENVNRVVPRHLNIVRPTQVYARANEKFLATFHELDHFGARPGVHYWGISNFASGSRPSWPATEGPKLFAYLDANSSLPGVLRAIDKLNLPTLVFISGKFNRADVGALAANVRIITDQLDLDWVADQCSIAILNGAHDATAKLLLAGKPILQLPMRMEHYLVAKRSTELGASLIVNPFKSEEISHGLWHILSDPNFAIRADQFRDHYRSWNPAHQASMIAKRIVEILKN